MSVVGISLSAILFILVAALLGINPWTIMLIMVAFAAGFAYGGGVWTL